MVTPNNRLLIILSGSAALLLIPFFAMQFTTEVVWTASDFIIAGILLMGTGLLCEMFLRIFKKRSHRFIAITLIVFACFLVWAELAVGLFGSPFAGS